MLVFRGEVLASARPMVPGISAAVAPFLAVALLLGSVGCSEPPPGGELPPEEPPREGVVRLGPEIPCDLPTSGFARFAERGLAAGLDVEVTPSPSDSECAIVPGGVVAEDLDGDGDVDLLFHDPGGFPLLFANDGLGSFTRVQDPGPASVQEAFGRPVMGEAVVDIDGDRLPEVVVVGASLALIAPNLGGLTFGDWEVLHNRPEYPRVCINSSAWGDIDADSDLDVVLLGLCTVPYEGAPLASAGEGNFDLLLLQDDTGNFELAGELSPEGTPGLSILAAFTDRDADGDLDLFVGSDRAAFEDLPPSAFFRNDRGGADSGPVLVNDAPEIGADLAISAMGFASADFNQDGRLDYCVSDVAPSLTCLQTLDSTYFESGLSLGLRPEFELMEGWDPSLLGWLWSTWSIEAIDLDADGRRDMVALGGPPPESGDEEEEFPRWQPDAIFQGTSEGSFEDRSIEVGFLDPSAHFGLAVADLSGDGFPDLVVGPEEGRPLLWDNPCGSGAWLAVDLVGAGRNTLGLGSRVEVV
ncbi:MAG: VCBS repeat-containing protein, partial [Myxococcota bacterium]|nr:VCBS repeat-containing protein [Myxococcota bacterium]